MGEYYPGVSGNLHGRPPESRRPRTQAALTVMDERGDRDSLEIASEIANNENHSIEARAPYIKLVVDHTHSKPAATPPLRFIIQPFEEGTFESEDQAEKFLAHVLMLVARGKQDIQSALDLYKLTIDWVNLKRGREELQIKALNSGAAVGESVIRVEGGINYLPGTNIPREADGVMYAKEPQPHPASAMNGHAMDPPPADDQTGPPPTTQEP